MRDGASRAAVLAWVTRTWEGCRRRAAYSIVLLTLLVANASQATALLTWPGWEPDKGATAWYWLRFVDPKAEVRVLPAGTLDGAGVFFDTPHAKFRRSQNESTFEAVLRSHPSSDPAIRKLAQLTRDIEINAWRPRLHPESKTLEAEFRRLQQRWPEADPPVGCVVEFFDDVHEWLARGRALDSAAETACSQKEGRR
jgi:hypothetical protein